MSNILTTTSRLTILRDPAIEYPELWMNVFIAADNPYEEASIIQMLVRSHCWRADTPDEADLVIFGGGSDVSPGLYGEEAMHGTYCNPARDNEDTALYAECLEKGIAMFGICRGAQFLNVMNGGKLYQDVDGHNGNHGMRCVRTNDVLSKVSSVHHQLCIENTEGGMEILGTSWGVSKERKWGGDKTSCQPAPDVEAFFYRNTGCFGVQGHPEYRGYEDYTKWCLDQITELFILNPDFELVDNLRRMKQDIREQRDKDIIAMVAKELS